MCVTEACRNPRRAIAKVIYTLEGRANSRVLFSTDSDQAVPQVEVESEYTSYNVCPKNNVCFYYKHTFHLLVIFFSSRHFDHSLSV